jgi:hypothetical protein
VPIRPGNIFKSLVSRQYETTSSIKNYIYYLLVVTDNAGFLTDPCQQFSVLTFSQYRLESTVLHTMCSSSDNLTLKCFVLAKEGRVDKWGRQ